MEIYFNELSVAPKASTKDESKEKIIQLLYLMKALRKYDITILRTYDGFYNEDLGAGYNPSSFLNDGSVSLELRTLLMTIVRNPTIDNIESNESEIFVNTKYETLNHNGKYVSPEGLAISHINNVPALSLINHPFWIQEDLILRVYEEDNFIEESIVNVSGTESAASASFLDWVKSITVDLKLNSKENILKEFPPEKYEMDNQAIDDILFWYYNDRRFLVRIKELIEDIPVNPFTGGKGKTEALGGTGGRASKRIVKKDRIVYTYSQEKIVIHQCRKHYDDK
ncbi:Txe/YoeB family addiction module toxin [Sphingobacterium hotanense]|uniref:Putative mRNA interferase YoeB n=1 Tax=Sphingobacterium hotanense TaxID=649196 RepID=A0ABT7NJ60_9SPHI|nr:Txe/YoeB family addiction module toxin [Sphingobacterium hotanense]MDM1047227.1 Txe/YoeB family addiction module toxin [Sphingobacterium hotanense]